MTKDVARNEAQRSVLISVDVTWFVFEHLRAFGMHLTTRSHRVRIA